MYRFNICTLLILYTFLRQFFYILLSICLITLVTSYLVDYLLHQRQSKAVLNVLSAIVFEIRLILIITTILRI